MAHVHANAAEHSLDLVGETRISRRVGVSIDGNNGSDGAKLVKHVTAANVASVENELDTRQCGEHVRTYEPVRVGDQTNDVLSFVARITVPHSSDRRLPLPSDAPVHAPRADDRVRVRR